MYDCAVNKTVLNAAGGLKGLLYFKLSNRYLNKVRRLYQLLIIRLTMVGPIGITKTSSTLSEIDGHVRLQLFLNVA